MIDCTNLTLTRGGKTVLSRFTYTFLPGRYYLLTGANGSGKSTLLSALSGLIEPSEGNIFAAKPEYKIRLMLQDPVSQILMPTVAEELSFSASQNSPSKERLQETVRKWESRLPFASAFPLAHDVSTSRLSGGEKQMTVAASLLASQPGLLLLDESTSMLDDENCAMLINWIELIRKENPELIIIHATHDARVRSFDVHLHMGEGALGETTDNARPATSLSVFPFQVPHATTELTQIRGPGGLSPWRGVQRCGPHCYGLRDICHPVIVSGDSGEVLFRAPLAAGGNHNGDFNSERELPGNRGAANDSDLLLRAEGIGCRFAKGDALFDNFSLALHRGEIRSVYGKNGSGKTTLLEILGGWRQPQSGTVAIAHDVSIGVLFQRTEDSFFERTVKREVTASLDAIGARDGRKDRCERLLATFRLEHAEHLDPAQLSGGEQRRLALACVMAANPDVMLLDEPFAGLDASNIELLWEVFTELLNEGKSILLVTPQREHANLVNASPVLLSRPAGVRGSRTQAPSGAPAAGGALVHAGIGKRSALSKMTSRKLLDFPPGRCAWLEHVSPVVKFVFFFLLIFLCMSTEDIHFLYCITGITLVLIFRTTTERKILGFLLASVGGMLLLLGIALSFLSEKPFPEIHIYVFSLFSISCAGFLVLFSMRLLELMESLEIAMKPLRVFPFNPRMFSLGVTLTIRFLLLLADAFVSIVRALEARNIPVKGRRALAVIATALIVKASRIIDDLSASIVSRGCHQYTGSALFFCEYSYQANTVLLLTGVLGLILFGNIL